MAHGSADLATSPGAWVPLELMNELLAIARSRGADFAEVYAQAAIHTAFTLEENRIKTSQLSVLQGVGVRALAGEETGYAYADGFDPEHLREAARVAAGIARGGPKAASNGAFRVVDAPPPFTLVSPAPLAMDEVAKIGLVRRANDAARAHDPRIREVTATLADSTQGFIVANSEGTWAEERQFQSRLTVAALALEGDQRQRGYEAAGGAVDADYFKRVKTPEQTATEAARTADAALRAGARCRCVPGRRRPRMGRRHGARVFRPQHGRRFHPQAHVDPGDATWPARRRARGDDRGQRDRAP